jgi:hypothetical protein
MHALSELDEHVRFRPVRRTHTVPFPGWLRARMACGSDGGESKELPLAQILAISTQATVQIPDDALLLREGERRAITSRFSSSPPSCSASPW